MTTKLIIATMISLLMAQGLHTFTQDENNVLVETNKLAEQAHSVKQHQAQLVLELQDQLPNAASQVTNQWPQQPAKLPTK